MADDGDLLRTTVAELVARQQASEALVVPDVAQVLAHAGPVDDQRAVVVVAGSLDGVEQQRRGVEGMCPERSRRLLAILHDVQRGERLRGRPDNPLVPVGAVAQVRTREVHALGLRNRHVVRVQQAISSHHRDALKAGHVAGLLDDEVAFRLEDREEQQLRRTRRNLGQHRNHVGVALVDRRERRDRAPKGLKGIRERLSQTLGVRIAVMDRRRRGHAQRVNSETSRCGALVQVVVCRAVVARVVVRTCRAGQVAGQRRAGVRWRDHHHARLGDQRSRSRRRTRTRRADHADNLLVGDDRLSGRLAAVSTAQVVQTGTHRHHESMDLPGTAHERLLDGALVRDAQERHITGDGVQRTDLDVLAGTHLNGAQRTITKMERHATESDTDNA